jgi:ribonuclease R
MTITAAEIIDFLETKAPQPLTAGEVLDPFKLSRPERKEALRLLAELAQEGTLVRIKGDLYALPRKINLVVGTVSAHRDGYGFVAPSSGGGADTFIPARYMREVMHGDRVVARIERGGRGGKTEGRIIRVLARAHQTVVGRYEAGRRFGYVHPADPRLGPDIFIPEGAHLGAQSGQIVIARIDVYPGQNRNAEGTVVEVLGNPDDPEVEILTLVHKYDLPNRFPDPVLAEAARVPATVGDQEREGREDLRALPFVTIDGETARDFDDAVTVRAEEGGKIRLWVAIADVGHYVKEGTPIDCEAYERSTSVYFPGSCIPMLPEALSNGICSLNPREDRLAMVAEMVFNREGKRVDSRFYPAVIRSMARLTYTEVAARLAPEDDAEAGELHPGLLPHLREMEELALRLMAVRRRRGSLDFDLPEAEIILDLRGKAENIVRAERNIAHRLVEEFMLAANEAVAFFLTERKAPLLYRVHEPPHLEKLQAFQEFVAHFNYGLVVDADGVDARRLQQLLAEAEGKPEERMINQVLLRSMKQARYAPENVGHFGLAADHYCHFTSPIRRYPDLIVHRVLREVLEKGTLPPGRKDRLQESLPEMGETTSRRERRAMEAEREIIDLKKCQFMAAKVGEEFDGYISGVTAFGFFVELKEFFVEGLVHISSVADDFYVYEEHLHRLLGQNRRRIFQIGDEVRVGVAKVNLERREIDFLLAGEVKTAAVKKPERSIKSGKPEKPRGKRLGRKPK